MEKEGLSELSVKIVERCLVPPCLPSSQHTLYLSNIDNHPLLRIFFNILLLYEASEKNSADLAKTIREALPKALEYYYPLAGRLRKKKDGKLQVECSGEGILFVEAMVDNTLSVLQDLDHLNPSFSQLFYKFPVNTNVEELPPVVLQVNHFMCGGFVVGASFHHSVCDGRGAAQFLKGLAEMARGHVKPSIEPIWDRELLKPRNQLIHDLDLVEEKVSTSQSCSPPKCEESVQMAIILDFETIKYMKQGIKQECEEECSTFEIVAALVWKVRTKALEIPHTRTVNLIFAVDVRGSFNPPLPNGFYGNGIVVACAQATVGEVVNESLSYIVDIIKKTKMSFTNKYLRSIIDMEQYPLDVYGNQDNTNLSDWRWMGFNDVDFGLGSPINVCPMPWNENGFIKNLFLFQHPSKREGNGFKMIMWMHPQEFRLFEIEVDAIIKKYVTNSSKCIN